MDIDWIVTDVVSCYKWIVFNMQCPLLHVSLSSNFLKKNFSPKKSRTRSFRISSRAVTVMRIERVRP